MFVYKQLTACSLMGKTTFCNRFEHNPMGNAQMSVSSTTGHHWKLFSHLLGTFEGMPEHHIY